MSTEKIRAATKMNFDTAPHHEYFADRYISERSRYRQLKRLFT
ncbi:hypothetical protein HMPREF1990_00767 [Porphyromonas gingivalis W4087]|uniref:Uncharacterized protein n=1 Tax=Porphyromonas gingivalis F0570 TaxID=1227271 RepID=A0A0E2LRD7_PORGN|nr:hypothetical protein HMPREF1555_00782 [Porphyromonas gingivalis F0570]ERJ68737.1 hypothetical protein HMPREF1553_00915 [Porphyromonas gingivalis F0568]ERJ89844.1 hypothetical protein HMPREF1990_00767 [Porphyromonas gingivalis W4087]